MLIFTQAVCKGNHFPHCLTINQTESLQLILYGNPLYRDEYICFGTCLLSDKIKTFLAIITVFIFRIKSDGHARTLSSLAGIEKYISGRFKLWTCFVAEGTVVLHKINDIIGKESYVEILQQLLKTSIRK